MTAKRVLDTVTSKSNFGDETGFVDVLDRKILVGDFLYYLNDKGSYGLLINQVLKGCKSTVKCHGSHIDTYATTFSMLTGSVPATLDDIRSRWGNAALIGYVQNYMMDNKSYVYRHMSTHFLHGDLRVEGYECIMQPSRCLKFSNEFLVEFLAKDRQLAASRGPTVPSESSYMLASEPIDLESRREELSNNLGA